jgi:hypothetical protein
VGTVLSGDETYMIDKSVMQHIPKGGDKKSYFLFDAGAFIIPYLRYNLYTFNRTNITPFIYMLETYFQLTAHARDYRCFFFIDNGVPEKIKSMYSAYKGNRRHSKHRSESKVISRNILETNEYVANRTLITQFFTLLGEGVFYYSEADYQLGYVLNKMISEYNIDGTQCYVMSHDKDLMALIGHCNCIRRLINSKEKFTKFWFFPKGDFESYLTSALKEDDRKKAPVPIYSYEEFIIHKSLTGDRGDNILAPIMCTEGFADKLFRDYKFAHGYYELDMEKTFEIIKEKLINKKIKKSDTSANRELIEERLAKEFRRNYLIFDVYNCDNLFSPVDRRFMDVVLQNVLNGGIKKNFNGALELLRRVSHSHADIFKHWFDDMCKWYQKNRPNGV